MPRKRKRRCECLHCEHLRIDPIDTGQEAKCCYQTERGRRIGVEFGDNPPGVRAWLKIQLDQRQCPDWCPREKVTET
jgi:hypothetical protein